MWPTARAEAMDGVAVSPPGLFGRPGAGLFRIAGFGLAPKSLSHFERWVRNVFSFQHFLDDPSTVSATASIRVANYILGTKIGISTVNPGGIPSRDEFGIIAFFEKW